MPQQSRIWDVLTGRQLLRILRWLGIMCFLAVVPPAFLLFAEFVLTWMSSSSKQGLATDFREDLPWIMLSFWAGTMGAILSYIYDRHNRALPSQPSVFVISHFLFGGLAGTISFYVIRSAFLIRLLYPNLPVSGLDMKQLTDYRATVAVAVVSGLSARGIVEAIRKRQRRD